MPELRLGKEHAHEAGINGEPVVRVYHVLLDWGLRALLLALLLQTLLQRASLLPELPVHDRRVGRLIR